MALQVLAVAWFTGTVFFLICYNGPCHKLPPALQLKYFEVSGEDQDIYAGVDLTDSRGLRYFPRLWCCPGFPCALQGSGCLCSRVSGMGCYLPRPWCCPIASVADESSLSKYEDVL